MQIKLVTGIVLAALLGQLLPARTADTGTIYATLAAQKEHTVLTIAAKEAGEIAALNGAGPWTLFAPTDAAFKKLDDETIGAIATKKEVVQRLLRSHLVMGKYTAADLKKLNGMALKTVHGNTLKVENTKDGVRVGGVLVSTDFVCSNGVIHVTNAVLPIPKR